MEQSRAITRKSASNLALAFILLSREKRDAMSALYAFCREVDDVADEDTSSVEQRRTTLEAWRADVQRACDGGLPELPVNRELKPFIRRYHLPFALFGELIRGCEMDLETVRFETWDQLELYCHRVASVVGLLSIEIFGYKNPRCRDYAKSLGLALQLTNILRDVKDDAARGRIYLPLEAMAQHGVGEGEILESRYTDRYLRLARAVAERARIHYRKARMALPIEDRRSMVAAELMGSVYWQLLLALDKARFNVFGLHPVRLTRVHKFVLVAEMCIRHGVGSDSKSYGD